MNRATLIAIDVSVALFGLVLMVGGLPAMIFGMPAAVQIGGMHFAYLWMVTCLLAQLVGLFASYFALRNIETR